MCPEYDAYLSQFTDYRSVTTFWRDFSIADQLGVEAIQDTYNRIFKEWKKDYKYLTELVMVLNHKTWQFYEQGKTNQRFEAYAELYDTLYKKAANYAIEHLEGDELRYYFQVTD